MHTSRWHAKSLVAALAGGALILFLPLLGVWVTGHPMAGYLQFPPRTWPVGHPGFSGPVFVGLALVIVPVVVLFLGRNLWCWSLAGPSPAPIHSFPWWGWAGLLAGSTAWLLAWSRLGWMAPLQAHTFTPLWLSYIVVVNAMTWRRTGACLLTRRPRYALLLFAVSALFWWIFEYLNRFSQNWYYERIADMGPWAYFLFATLPFSTVLPAVLGTAEWLASYPRIGAGLDRFLPLRPRRSRCVRFGAGSFLSCLALFALGLWPDLLFPALWIAPLFLLDGLQRLGGTPTLFTAVRFGYWRRIYLLALSGLLCGFFWEMWNEGSLARWCYSVPYVDRFHLFRMPLLGYAGYLPFGLECGLVADMVAMLSARQGQGGGRHVD